MAMSLIKDPSLAPEGHRKMDWAGRHMPVLNALRRELTASRPLQGIRVGMCLHLEAKTAYLAETLHLAGAQVAIAGSNPLSTQDDVCAALAERGVLVFAWHGVSPDEYIMLLERVLDTRPHILIDDGADLTALLHTQRPELLSEVIGGCEETTTGVIRLRAMEAEGLLRIPVLAVNDALSKFLFDNRYGTGQSALDGVMRSTNLLVAGKRFVVVGFGWVGKGVAARARGMGAKVIVTEVDPFRALEAHMEGYEVMSLLEAAPLGDFFVTCTGCRDVIDRPHLERMKDGAILANAGHFDVEINLRALSALAVQRREIRRNIEEFSLADGRRLYLIAQGRLVNLAAADGHPAEIMDMSFALQALGSLHILAHGREMPAGVHRVPDELDRRVAELKLQTEGLALDTLSESQKEYLKSWRL
jgi:adenosylhomocysteinase